MGIQGLLKALKPYSEVVHVKKYSGHRVGIDAYSWLHKGAYACGMELQLDDSRSKRRKLPLYVSYCMHRIRMLKYNNVTPVVVFDGGRLPLKASTEQERRRIRETNLENAQKKHAEGDMSGAQEFYQRAVEITPAMAHELIEVLREEGVEFVVAPYEADAQLAHLAGLPRHKGGITAIISEDSDLLAYGCKAVLFKMDRYGQCEEICLPKVFECDTPLKALGFKGFTQDLFLCMCVMAGCDFLASIPGIGVKRAHALLAKYRNISRVLSKLKLERSTTFPENYIADFSQAKAIFDHARVYDREKRELVLLNPLPDELMEEFEGDLDFLGPDLPQSRAKAIAEGRLDPITMEAFNSIPSPKTPVLTNRGIKEVQKNIEFSPSPITPFTMYGLRKESPKLPKSGSFFSPKNSKPSPPPASPFGMFTSKKGTSGSFDSPSLRVFQIHGTNESSNINALEVEHTQIEFASSMSEVSSEVTVTYEQRIPETAVSVSGCAFNDASEMDQTFLAQLKFIAGCGTEAPTQNSTTDLKQSTSPERGIAPYNPFKRKTVETSSKSLTEESRVRRDDEDLDPISSGSAQETCLTRLREISWDESDCETISPRLASTNCSSFLESELRSQTDSTSVQSGVGDGGSSSSVLKEISPNFEVAEDSPCDSNACVRPSSSVQSHQHAGTISVKSRPVKTKMSSVQNDRSRSGRKSKSRLGSPTNPPGGGIRKFFKPV